MRIIRYMAPDTRHALRAVREQLGEDAVILTSKRTAEGVEVTAATDFDATRLEKEGVTGVPPVAESTLTTAPAPPAGDPPLGAFVAAGPIPSPAPEAAADAPPAAATDSMSVELRILRRMLESQLEQLAWNERTRRTPVLTEMLRELTEIGILPELAERITEQLPESVDLAAARRFAFTALSQYLPVSAPRWADEGGRVALIGCTGAGKTTTLAKMAVRWVLRHGSSDLALVAADSVRIGAHGELQSLGQMLGAQVYTPDSLSDLAALLAQLTRFRLVLIDTPGTSVRDPHLSATLTVLANCASTLESVLVLPANIQLGALEEAISRFAPTNPRCCVLTKLDEAASLGGVLSLLIRARLPVAYVSEGQRVPEDLQPARSLELVSTAVRLAKAANATADEDMLRRRFGKVTHARA